jgi:peptide/nickel transport system substrate-binding protein
VDAEPVTGGDLSASIQQDPGCVDPHQTSLRQVLQWGRQVVDSLVYEGEGGEVSSWLASEWSVNEDATEFTFVVRDDVVFSDGTGLDAEVVKANFDAMKAAGSTATVAASYLANYTETEVVDASTAIIKFSAPNAQFLYGASTPNLGIFSGDTAGLSAEALCAGDYAASGPFTVGEYAANERIVLEKNADYAWGPDALDNSGAAYLDTLTFNVITDTGTATGAAASGELDMLWGPQEQDIPTLDDAGFSNADLPEPALSASWIINPDTLVGTDLAVRQALSLGIDRELLLSTRPDTMQPATGILNSAHPFYVDQSEQIYYDADEAIEILEADGWTEVGSDGIRSRDGERLTVDTIFYTSGAQPVMELAKQQLEEIGLELTLTPVTANEETARMAEGNFDMRVSWFTGPEPTVIANVLRGADATVDEYILEQASIAEFEPRSAIVGDFMDYIAENALLIPMWEQNATPFWSSQTLNMTRDVAGLVMFTQVQLSE